MSILEVYITIDTMGINTIKLKNVIVIPMDIPKPGITLLFFFNLIMKSTMPFLIFF